MLQKTQSKHLNRWKHAIIFPLLVGFVFLFNTEVIAKEIHTPAPPANELITGTNDAGDVLVQITKTTTIDELKAIQKMFKSMGITMSYNVKKFNSKNEITEIEIKLKDKDGGSASANFESSSNKPIPNISLGKAKGLLVVTSSQLSTHKNNGFVYEIHEDHDGNSEDKRIVVGSKHSGGIKTIEIVKDGDKEEIIIDGKKVTQKEYEKIKKKSNIHIDHDGDSEEESIFIFSNDDGEDSKVKIKVSQNSFHVDGDGDGDKEPLYVIDGKIVASKDKVTKLDSKKIESISVLKGAQAKAKYGKKGKNGVIEITTKGKKR